MEEQPLDTDLDALKPTVRNLQIPEHHKLESIIETEIEMRASSDTSSSSTKSCDGTPSMIASSPLAEAWPTEPDWTLTPQHGTLESITKESQYQFWLREKVKHLDRKLKHSRRKRKSARSHNLAEKRELEHMIQSLEQGMERMQITNAQYKTDLKNEKKLSQSFQLRAEKAELQLSKAYSKAMSAWQEDVSRDMPDDVIKNTISTFFQGDFLSWCADMAASEISQGSLDDKVLQRCDFINQTGGYRASPAHLKFDHSKQNESAPLILLEAALSSNLCRSFLTTAYFGIRGGKSLQAVEQTLSNNSVEAAIDWRVTTMKGLGTAASLQPAVATRCARQFAEDFAILLKDMDEDALADLKDLFIQFSNIALKLWAIKTRISISDPAQIWTYNYNSRVSSYLDYVSDVGATKGERLNGRPFGVVLRPCIVSEPVPKDGQEPSQVIWSKGVVWVSSEKEPVDRKRRRDGS